MSEGWQQQDQYRPEPEPEFVPEQVLDTAYLVGELMREIDRIKREFVLGQSNFPKYTEELGDVDEKLNVFGLGLLYRPWEETATPISTKPRGGI